MIHTTNRRCSQYGQCMVHTPAGVAGAADVWFIRTGKMNWKKLYCTGLTKYCKGPQKDRKGP